jgi:hypothetical protein
MWVYFGDDEQLIQSKTEILSQAFTHKRQKSCSTCQRNKATEVDVNSGVLRSLCIFV